MWFAFIMGLCLGLSLMKIWRVGYFKWTVYKEQRAVRVLEKVVWWIFERKTLNDEEMDAILLESVACGCQLSDLLERRIVLFENEKRFPPGELFIMFGLKMAYLYPYFPSGRQLLQEDRFIAEQIYRFKHGSYASGLLDEFCLLFQKMGLEKGGYMLLCIPASNWERTEQRFLHFSRDLAIRMEWTDGFGSLVPIPRIPLHLSGQRRLLSTEDFKVDKKRLKGKKIVLLDDMLTSGTTVLSISKVLKSMGARPVAAVFISRTLEKPLTWRDVLCR